MKSTAVIHDSLGATPSKSTAVTTDETEIQSDADKLQELQEVLHGFLELAHDKEVSHSIPLVDKKSDKEKPKDALERIFKAISHINSDLEHQITKKVDDLSKDTMIKFITKNQKSLNQFLNCINEITTLWLAEGMPGAMHPAINRTLQCHDYAKELANQYRVKDACLINDTYKAFGKLLFSLDGFFNKPVQAGKTTMYEPDRVRFTV